MISDVKTGVVKDVVIDTCGGWFGSVKNGIANTCSCVHQLSSSWAVPDK